MSRVIWYALTAPSWNTATVPTTAATARNAIWRHVAAPANSIKTSIIAKESIVPRSGCRKIRNDGIATKITARAIRCQEKGGRPALTMSAASASTTASLANSDGWNW